MTRTRARQYPIDKVNYWAIWNRHFPYRPDPPPFDLPWLWYHGWYRREIRAYLGWSKARLKSEIKIHRLPPNRRQTNFSLNLLLSHLTDHGMTLPDACALMGCSVGYILRKLSRYALALPPADSLRYARAIAFAVSGHPAVTRPERRFATPYLPWHLYRKTEDWRLRSARRREMRDRGAEGLPTRSSHERPDPGPPPL